MKNGNTEVLALGDRFSSAYTSIEHVLHQLGDVTYQDEKKFEKAIDVIEHVRNSSYDVVVMPNPYGNERRMWVYNHLRKYNFPVVVFDRGALPKSWFFDIGFNADSPTYAQLYWNKPIADKEIVEIKSYIESIKYQLDPLEKQGHPVAPADLRKKLGILNKKILLVAFQRPSDTTIKYFSGPIKTYENFCELVSKLVRMISEFAPEWEVIAKKHPLETTRPSANIKFADDNENINSLIEVADMVLVVNSGVGLLASLWNKPVLYAGDAFYACHDLNRQVKNELDVLYYLNNPFSPSEVVRDRLVHHLVNRVYSFGNFTTEISIQKDGSTRNITKHIDFEILRFPPVTNTKKKRCLMISSVLPVPVNRGNAQRTDQMIRGLLELDYKIDLLLLNQSEASASSESIRNRTLVNYNTLNISATVRRHPMFSRKKQLVAGWGRWIKKHFSQFVYSDAKINSSDNLPENFKKLILNNVKSNYDLIWFNYAKLVPDELPSSIGYLVDLHDLQSARIRNDVLPKLPTSRRKRYERIFSNGEREIIRRAAICLSISSVETAEIKNGFCPEANIYTVNATDYEKFISVPEYSTKYNLLFVGSNSDPNVDGLIWFLVEVWPIIISQSPKTTLLIQGNITRNKRVISAIGKSSGIFTQGFVQDLSSVYQDCNVVICPILYGTGMKIKVVEAMSYGMPIVATSAALEGIEQSYGMAPYDSVSEFAERVISLLNSPEDISRAMNVSRKTFADNHSRHYLISRLRQILV